MLLLNILFITTNIFSTYSTNIKPLLTFYDFDPETQSGWVDFGIDLSIDCLQKGYYEYGISSLFRIGRYNETWSDCWTTNNTTPKVYGLPSSRILADKGLYKDWRKNVRLTVDLIKPLINEGVVIGVFLGDEQVCGGHQTWDEMSQVAYEFRYLLGDTPILYMNECVGAITSSITEIPSALTYFSIDIYDSGAEEVAKVKTFYEDKIFPILYEPTKAFVIPGIFGNPTKPFIPQEKLLLEKIKAYKKWIDNETQIAGLNPWHYLHRTNIKYPNDTYPYGLGVIDFPRVLHKIQEFCD
jgi:hypothetical protein